MLRRHIRTRLEPILAALLLSVASGHAAQVLSPEWRVELGARPAIQPVPFGDGAVADGLLVPLASGEVVVVSPRGEERSRFRLDNSPVSVTVAPASGGGQPLVFAVDSTGSIYCFHLTGERVWKYQRTYKIVDQRPAVLIDLDRDGAAEVFAADSKGHLYAVDRHGRPRLEISEPGEMLSMPAAVDLNDGGAPGFVFASKSGGVYCARSNGELIWGKQLSADFGGKLPLIADADHDGRYEAYVTSGLDNLRGLFALDAATGKLLWYAPAIMQASSWITPVDLDGDGRDEILYSDKSNRIFAVDSKGQPKWQCHLGGAGPFWAPAIARLGTGEIRIFQIVRGSDNDGNSLYALDAGGQLLQSIALPGGGSNSPFLLRLPGQDEPRLIVVSASGALSCFRLNGGVRQVLSPGPRMASTKMVSTRMVSARAPSVRRAPASPATSAPGSGTVETRQASGGSNSITLASAPAGALGSLRVENPDGTIHVNLLRVPTSTVSFSPEGPGTYQVTTGWLGDAGSVRRFQYRLDADFTHDRELLANHLRDVDSLRPALPRYAPLIAYLDGNAKTSLALAANLRAASRFDAAHRSWRQGSALLGYLKRHNTSGPLAVTVLDNPWVDLDATRLFEGATAASNQVRISMLGGEFESAAVAITNLEPDPVTVRATAQAFQSRGGKGVSSAKVVEFRGVPLIRTDMGQTMEDPLPLLGDDQTLRIEPGETVKLWLRFRSHSLEAGQYRSTLSFRGLLQQSAAVELPVTLDVSPVRLSGTFRYKHCNWLSPTSFMDPELREAAIEDALEHGTNVFDIPGVSVPVAADGTLGTPETAAQDAVARRLRGKALLLISGAIHLTGPGAQAGGGVNTKAFVEAVRWYVNHMQALGLGYDDYAMYIVDEPALYGHDAAFDKFVADVRRLKAADPRVQIYANPTGAATAEILAPLRGLVDIWCPWVKLVQASPQLHQLCQSGKQFWHYEAKSEQRSLDPLGYYRRKPWLSYSLGMTGGGFWIYQNFSYDWTPATHDLPEYGTVYPAARGWVTSKRWEASLDGSEDYELLRIIEDRTRGTALHDEARRLIKEAVAFVDQAPTGTAPDFAKWSAYRQRIIDLLRRSTAAI
ncbi:MAG: PQQ-binding-like beta-propeller repeat protein [Bryobacterales bacterium]|nr:PQQ-binding-like beta-propeller repeat protein [Bryobacterales bacterium]